MDRFLGQKFRVNLPVWIRDWSAPGRFTPLTTYERIVWSCAGLEIRLRCCRADGAAAAVHVRLVSLLTCSSARVSTLDIVLSFPHDFALTVFE
jgi:hypothetical protein